MVSDSKTAVVGVGALFVGALLGGVLGNVLGAVLGSGLGPRPGTQVGGHAPASPPPASPPPAPAPPPPLTALPDDGVELLRALGDLTDEVRGMRAALEAQPTDHFSSADGTPELERLTELLNVLATSLKYRPRVGTPPGYQGAPLVVPSGKPRRDRLADLADLPEEERSTSNRFLTYQQVLDRYGPPDEVTRKGLWIFDDPLTGVEVYFQFIDGLVTNVY